MTYFIKLEGHSVERMYLRQRCSDDSVNKTFYKNYRKQIAHQLRTQYVDGTHNRPKYYTVTLKSRLRITQGHWKQNDSTDHTRLTINRVI